MPLFGKKKDNSHKEEKKGPAPTGYPCQGAYYAQGGYPTQGAPQQPGAAAMAPPPYQPPGAAGPPPPYAPSCGPVPQQAQYYPQVPQPMQQQRFYPPGAQVHVPNCFDSGARFDGISQPSIPPPPPGVAPNAAQLAAMQGNTVIAGQQKSDFWEGSGSGGGYTIF